MQRREVNPVKIYRVPQFKPMMKPIVRPMSREINQKISEENPIVVINLHRPRYFFIIVV
jgi:hypothetical protein